MKKENRNTSLRLTVKYREEIETFINRLIDNCNKCEGTNEIKSASFQLLAQLSEYNKWH